MASLRARALAGLPELSRGDDLAALIAAAAESGGALTDGQLIVIAHKAVSKCEGAVVALAETLIVLPRDPDGSARRIRARLRELTGARVGVLITDSFGRAWRNGQVDVAIGLAGMQPLEDWRGRSDSRGMELRATWLAVADAAAAVGELVRAKDSREPVVLVEGLERLLGDDDGPGVAPLLRPLGEDMFR